MSQVVEVVLPDGAYAVLGVAGSGLFAMRWDGTELFTDYTSRTHKILHVFQGAAATGPLGLILSGKREVRLVELISGAERWHYQAPEGTDVSGAGSSKLVPEGDGFLWLVAPCYAEFISCFEIAAAGHVRLRWTRDFAGRYDRGFGPVLVVSDLWGTGERTVLMSSRIGSDYGTGGSEVPTERLVLGRADGHLYQAVLDLARGQVLAEVAYLPDPSEYPCARPYGLLQVVGSPAARVAVLISCQVEEYYAATRLRDGELMRAWGEFVEKDWPIDAQELRPQTSSLARADSDSPVLVTGHFDGERWRTVLRAAATGGELAAIPGNYFWGTLRAEEEDILILSPAGQRPLDGTEPLRAVRLDDLQAETGRVAARPVTCGTDILPPDLSFHALRASMLTLRRRDSAQVGIVVTDSVGVSWWDPLNGEVWPIAEMDVVAGYPGVDGAAVLVDRSGHLHRLDTDLRVRGALTPRGCRPQGLAATAGGRAWLVAPRPDGATMVAGGRRRWRIPGRVQALAADDGGVLAASVEAETRLRLYRCDAIGVSSVSDITGLCAVSDVAFIDSPSRLVIAERTGVHTAALGVYELDGTPVWRDPEHGPHPNHMLCAADRFGRWHVVYDDHGLLRHRAAHTGHLLGESDWPAAYTTPVWVRYREEELLLRVGGIHGVEALDDRLRQRWRLTAPLWRYFPGEAAVAEGRTGPVLGSATADGAVDVIDIGTGSLIRTVAVGPLADRPPLLAVDVTGGGYQDFVVGTAAGALLVVDSHTGDVHPLPVAFDAAIEYLAAADTTGGGYCELIVGSADGMIHVVAGEASRRR